MVDADWTFTRSTGALRYVGGDHSDSNPSYATVIECHRWLQDLADDAVAQGDDELDITNINPSSRSYDNLIYFLGNVNIDATAAEHLYDGTIIQNDGDERFDGIVNFGNLDVQIQIHQNGAVLSDDWWNYAGGGLNPDSAQGISHRFLIQTRSNGVDIDGRRVLGICRRFGYTYKEFLINGTSFGNNVLALDDGNDINNNTAEGTVSGWTTITNTEGLRNIDVNADGSTEQYYSEWNRDSYTINQFTERMKWLTRDGTSSTINGLNGELFRGITHSFAYDNETGGAPSTNDEYAWGTAIAYSGESGGPFTVGEAIWENSSSIPEWKGRILAVDDDGATGTLIVDVRTGTVSDSDPFVGQTSGASATANGTPSAVTGGGVFRFFAVDDQGTDGYLYGQLMKGTAPSNNTRMYDDADVGKYLDVNDTSAFPIEAQAVETPFFGLSTGSAIIGAYGFGLEVADLSNNDSVTALDGNPYSPPTYTTNTVGGLVANEDYVFVAPWDGASYDLEGKAEVTKDQLSLNVALTTDNITQVEVTETIPTDTPSTGTIRVTDNNGFERRLEYSGWENSSINYFTITTTDGNEDFGSVNASIGNDVYVTYIDQLITAGSTLNFQVTYSTNRDLVVKVRDGGSTPIKEFISEWSITSSNQTLNAQRISDT
jgi:hypothetical protein